MQFGLWFEPEMVNLDSDLARQHPEWVFDDRARARAIASSRHQHVLDLGAPRGLRPRARADRRARRPSTGIDYLKWDHNRDLVDARARRRRTRRASTSRPWPSTA